MTVVPGSALAFDAEFQRKLVKLALIDDSFCSMAMRFVGPQMFESDALRWCWITLTAEREAGRTPTLLVLRDRCRQVEQVLQPRYRAMLDAIDQDVLREDAYIRHALAEWVKRNLFVEAYNNSQRVYNAGKADAAIELMRVQVEKIYQITFEAPKRYIYYSDLDARQRHRETIARSEWEHTFPTGIVGVDEVLDGGLSRGEIGVWMADSKGGKSIFLCHLAGFTTRALHRKVLFILLEGSYLQTASRLDAWHARSLYKEVKRGEFDAQTWQALQHEFQILRNLMVIREMTDKWDYSVRDIRAELDDLKGQHGWVPDEMVVDYGDLCRSDTPARSEEEHQRNAFAALKSMTAQDNGYAIWTASQARRPTDPWRKKKKMDDKSEQAKDEPARELDEDSIVFGKKVLRAQDVADSYNKIRRCDFIGSINQDEEDKQKEQARLWCDRYRDNAASRQVLIKQDLDRMLFVDVMHEWNRPDRKEKLVRDIEKAYKRSQAQRADQVMRE